MLRAPAFEKTTQLVARALGMSAEEIQSGFQPAGLDDLNAVCTFRARNFDELIAGDDLAYLQWRYRFGRPGSGMGEMWILRRGHDLLGIVGTEDLTCKLADNEHLGVRTMDILVAREMQNSGLGVWLNQAIFRRFAFTIAVGSNRNSKGTVSRLFHTMPPLVEWRMLIDPENFVRRRIPVSIISTPISAALGSVLRLLRRFEELRTDSSMSVETIVRFDDRVSRLHGPTEPTEAALVRTAESLNYRLFANPRGNYSAAGAWQGGQLVGAVSWRAANHDDGRLWAHIIDIRTFGPDRAAVLKKLLLHVGRQAEAAGCTNVSLTMHGVKEEQALWTSGFLAARNNQKVFGLYANDPSVFSALSSAVWSLTDLCDDNDGR